MEVEFSQEKTQASLGLNSWFLTCFFFPFQKEMVELHRCHFLIFMIGISSSVTCYFYRIRFFFCGSSNFFDTHTHI